MKDFLDPILKDRKKLMIVGGGAAAVLVVLIVVVMVASGGGDEEIEFEFDDPPVEQGPSVEEQVQLTVQAMQPTPTPEPTPDIPATLAAAVAATAEAQPTPGPDSLASPVSRSALTPADSRYLDALGRPVWLSVQAYFELRTIYDQTPDQYLVVSNFPKVQSIVGDMRRAVELLESSVVYSRDASGPVKHYARYIDEQVYRMRDAANESAALFALIDFADESYEDLPRVRREELNEIHYRVGDYLARFDRDMQQFGCSACGETFRGQ